MMVCDHCNIKVCHNYCADPPIDFIPENEFFCKFCVAQHNLVNNFIRPNLPQLESVKIEYTKA